MRNLLVLMLSVVVVALVVLVLSKRSGGGDDECKPGHKFIRRYKNVNQKCKCKGGGRSHYRYKCKPKTVSSSAKCEPFNDKHTYEELVGKYMGTNEWAKVVCTCSSGWTPQMSGYYSCVLYGCRVDGTYIKAGQKHKGCACVMGGNHWSIPMDIAIRNHCECDNDEDYAICRAMPQDFYG